MVTEDPCGQQEGKDNNCKKAGKCLFLPPLKLVALPYHRNKREKAAANARVFVLSAFSLIAPIPHFPYPILSSYDGFNYSPITLLVWFTFVTVITTHHSPDHVAWNESYNQLQKGRKSSFLVPVVVYNLFIARVVLPVLGRNGVSEATRTLS